MNMKRRHFIKLVGGMAMACPFVLHAQPLARVARIGFLGSASASGSAKSVEALRTGLRDLGYVEGKNIVIEFRWAEGRYDRLAALVAEGSTLIEQTIRDLNNNLSMANADYQSKASRLNSLNAQLQSVLSLQTYATATGDTAASSLATRMEQAAAATISRFDTGYWTYYSLAGNPSPLSYAKYVVQLLRKLAPADPRFAHAADHFAAYLQQAPAFKLATAPVGSLRFWLSKPAYVSASTPAGPSVRLSLGAGWHTLRWGAPKRGGFYPISVTAVDYAGNRASFATLPIVAFGPHMDLEARERALAAGCTEFLANSKIATDLAHVVARYIGPR